MNLVPRITACLIVILYLECEVLCQRSGALGRYPSRYNGQRMVQKCGPELNTIVELVCNGVYHSQQNSKKAEEAPTQFDAGWVNNEENYAIYPFRSKRSALAYGSDGGFRRRSRGIVEECCYRSCTEDHIRQYCGR